jgi:hypothetical protein
MKKAIFELSDEAAGMLNLGAVLGQNQAFALVAGRCSAAQAATLLRLRQDKQHLKCGLNWREFCVKYLNISGSEADRLIRLWEEFGAGYFELSQLMPISAESYRAIEPAVKDGALHHDGEAIPLDNENRRKLVEAVAQLRHTAGAGNRAKQVPPCRPMHQRLEELDRRCSAIIAEFDEISRKERHGENWLLFTGTLTRVRGELSRIERENGL